MTRLSPGVPGLRNSNNKDEVTVSANAVLFLPCSSLPGMKNKTLSPYASANPVGQAGLGVNPQVRQVLGRAVALRRGLVER